MARRRPSPALATLLAVGLSTVPAAAPAATFGDSAAVDGTLPSPEGFLEFDGNPFGDVSRIDAAVTALEERLRDHADLASVLDLAPRLMERLPRNARLLGLHATALAASGDTRAARAALDGFAGNRDQVWFDIARGLVARNEGDLDAAEAAIAAALAAEPDNAYALSLSGTLAAARGDLAAASADFAAAAAAAPEAASYHANLGAVRLQLGEPGQALAALDRASELDRENCRTRQMRAAALTQQGRPADAAEALAPCLAAQPGNRDLVHAYLSALLTAGDLEAASEALDTHEGILSAADIWRSEIALRRGDAAGVRAALDATPNADSPAAAERLAYAALLDGAFDPTLQRLAPMLSDNAADPALRLALFALHAAAGRELPDPLVPETPAEHLLAAFSAADAGATGMADDHLRRAEGAVAGFAADGLAAETLPDRPALGALAAGAALMLRGVDGAAADALETAAESGAPLSLYLAAVSARRSGDDARASDLLTRAITVAPGFRSAFLERAEAALALDDGDAALADLRTALDLRPSPAIALRLGVMAEALDDVETARHAYETLLELAPDSYVANNQLAWFLVSRDGETTRALELASRADALRPGNASVLDTLGWIHFLRGDLDTAKRYLEEAFDVSGGTMPVIRYHLAEVAFRTGQADRAGDLLDGLADVDTESMIARDVAELRARIAEGERR